MRSREKRVTFPAKVTGRVVHGTGRGRGMGFPTINVAVEDEVPQGVYAGRVRVRGESHAAAVHVGPVPTFDEEQPVLEAHLLDFSEDCYGETAQVELIERIRPVEAFDDPDTLARRIAEDVNRVRELTAGGENE